MARSVARCSISSRSTTRSSAPWWSRATGWNCACRSSAPSAAWPCSTASPGSTASRSPAPRSSARKPRTDMDAAAGIHASAVVDPSARIGKGVSIGAFTLVGPGVEIGDGTSIGAHCSILGPTRIGRDNRIHGHAAIGGDPQDKKFQGEHAELVIGDRNVIREFTTINRGTGNGGGITRIGDDNWLLAYVHVAHDCQVGNGCIFSNNATLAGHVEIGDQVILSGFAGIHQFCRIGAHAFIGMGAFVNGDVPPYVLVAQE